MAVNRESKSRPKSHDQKNSRSKKADEPYKNFTPINALKSKIRSISRVLAKPDKLPANVMVEKARALVGFQHDLAEAEAAKAKRNMIRKYHMVRFFGRDHKILSTERVQLTHVSRASESRTPSQKGEQTFGSLAA